MLPSAVDPELADTGRAHLKALELWTFSENERGVSCLRIKKLRDETLVIYISATGTHEMRRLRSQLPGQLRHAKPPADIQSLSGSGALEALTVVTISENEFEELATLRKARGWDTPIFQPHHPQYRQAMGRLTELEAKERAASASAPV